MSEVFSNVLLLVTLLSFHFTHTNRLPWQIQRKGCRCLGNGRHLVLFSLWQGMCLSFCSHKEIITNNLSQYFLTNLLTPCHIAVLFRSENTFYLILIYPSANSNKKFKQLQILFLKHQFLLSPSYCQFAILP